MPDSTVHNHPPASPNPTPKQALRVALAALSWLVLAAKALGFWVMVPLPLQLAIGLVLVARPFLRQSARRRSPGRLATRLLLKLGAALEDDS